MAEPINPYASPQTVIGSTDFDPLRTLTAKFPRTWKVHSKMALAAPNPWSRRAAWTILLAPALIYTLYWLPPLAFFSARQQAAWCWMVGLLIPMLTVSVAEQIGWWIALQRLRKDPILGTAGQWIVTIDLANIKLQTPGGIASWPCTITALNSYEKSLALIVDQQTAIYIPATADFGEETFAIWKETLEARWRSERFGPQLASHRIRH
ncbi:hypothetical protein ETAA8_08620 [Anatilimnocola aggregata]|uniref:YcxB-like protein domain-containing protein n=1 Tax=Anatilimnocola aggregata TaxID=2528021 RepID=A0A517Y6D2_9BACT|nr:hypothetical protein [Anatilimnocola aggregata]QDU25791.1 hypothetical protein ETAA8_08620 [Anatilimnocola aggregata]